MLAALDHVQLAAPPGSEDRLRAYYSGVLGMTEVPKPPVLAARGGCWFEAGTVQPPPGCRGGLPPRPQGPPRAARHRHRGVRGPARRPRRPGHLGRHPPRPSPLLQRGPGRQPAGVPGTDGAGPLTARGRRTPPLRRHHHRQSAIDRSHLVESGDTKAANRRFVIVRLIGSSRPVHCSSIASARFPPRSSVYAGCDRTWRTVPGDP